MVCWSGIKNCHGTAFSGEAAGDLEVVHSKTRNLTFLTLINVNNDITVSVPTQVLPGSSLETWDFLFLEILPPPFTSQAETVAGTDSNPFVLKLLLLQGQADCLSQSLSGLLAS